MIPKRGAAHVEERNAYGRGGSGLRGRGSGSRRAWLGQRPLPATPQSLSGIQAKAAAAISLRVNDLNAAITKVKADSRLGSDNAALATYLQADIAPLQALGQTIAGDTSRVDGCRGLRHDLHQLPGARSSSFRPATSPVLPIRST